MAELTPFHKACHFCFGNNSGHFFFITSFQQFIPNSLRVASVFKPIPFTNVNELNIAPSVNLNFFILFTCHSIHFQKFKTSVPIKLKINSLIKKLLRKLKELKRLTPRSFVVILSLRSGKCFLKIYRLNN